MRGFFVAGLICAVSATYGHAQDACSTARAEMTRASKHYGGMVDQLLVARRGLGRFGTMGDEDKLRAVRQFGLLQRDTDAQRSRVLVVYEALIAGSCEPFDRTGYDKTVETFRRASGEEREALAQAKRDAALKVLGAN
jgi:hypothetical protein